MKRVYFLNRFFLPDHSATSRILGDVTTHLQSCGHDIHVITSQQLYDQPRARLPPQEVLSGVHVHRLATTHFGRGNLLGRAVDYVSFYIAARRALLAAIRPGDIVVAMTDPPLISIVAMRAAHRHGALLVNWLQDIYPEVAFALGVSFLNWPTSRWLFHLRDRSLRAAAANVVVGELMIEKMTARGVPTEHIDLIPNWCEDDEICSVAAGENPLRREWGLEGKFVVGYSGNLGRAHEYDTVLAAAKRLKDAPHILFVCIGGGHLMKRLAEQVRQCGLGNFRFINYQDQHVLRFSLSVPDVHWISLRPAVEGLLVPSKVYGIAAAGRPIIAICDHGGEIARIVEKYQCGWTITPGDSDALAEAIIELSGNAGLRAEMGRKARAMIEACFTRKQALEHWRQLLERVDGPG
jgi:glycosyltransferase involved in cell wall biosynthesis